MPKVKNPNPKRLATTPYTHATKRPKAQKAPIKRKPLGKSNKLPTQPYPIPQSSSEEDQSEHSQEGTDSEDESQVSVADATPKAGSVSEVGGGDAMLPQGYAHPYGPNGPTSIPVVNNVQPPPTGHYVSYGWPWSMAPAAPQYAPQPMYQPPAMYPMMSPAYFDPSSAYAQGKQSAAPKKRAPRGVGAGGAKKPRVAGAQGERELVMDVVT